MATPTAFPYTLVPDSLQFGITHNVQLSTTTLSKVIQTVELPGARWKASLTYTNLTELDALNLRAFLVSLRGMSGRFYLYDFSKTGPYNTSITSCTNVLTGSTQRVLNFTPSGGAFVPGDYITFYPAGFPELRELKMITKVVGSAHTVEPACRSVPATGDAIEYTNCKGVFMLSTNEQVYWSASGKSLLNDFNIECVEA